MHDDQHNAELASLLEKLSDVDLDHVERGQLSEVVASDTDSMAEYLEWIQMDAALEWLHVPAPEFEPPESGVSEQESEVSSHESEELEDAHHSALSTHHSKRRFRASHHKFSISISVAVAVLVSGLLAMHIMEIGSFIAGEDQNKAREAPRETPEPEVVARLSDWHDTTWLEDSQPRLRDPRLTVGQRLVLASGLAEISYDSGAKVILEGPAEYVVTGKKYGYLGVGGLSVEVTDEPAKGFIVETPTSQIEDLGTKFGVLVSRTGDCEVAVMTGRVQVAIDDGAGGRTVTPLGQGAGLRLVSRRSQSPRIVMIDRPNLGRFDISMPPPRYVAYEIRRGAEGNQNYSGALGHDFVVKRPITVTGLGAFDSGADGLKRTITVELWSRDDAGTPEVPRDDMGIQKIATLEFTSEDAGKLRGSNRIKPLDSQFELTPGAYTIVAHGYGMEELVGNSGHQSRLSQFKRLDDGNGAIAFVGSSRFGDDVSLFPLIVDKHGVSQYAAGTFEFIVSETESIEPSSFDVRE